MKASLLSRGALFLLAVCLIPRGLATDYYVDADTGNDSNIGTDSSQPWKTLDKVNTIDLEPGDSVNIKAGTSYTTGDFQTVLVLTPEDSGVAGQPVTIRSYGSGAKPLLYQTYSMTRNSAVLGLFGAVSNIVVDGLHLKGVTGVHNPVSGRDGIDVFSTALLMDSSMHTGITIRNCEIEGGTRGLLLYNCQDVTISNNYLHDINGASKNTHDTYPLWPEQHPGFNDPNYPLDPATHPVGADDDSGAEAIDLNTFCENIAITSNVIANCYYNSYDYGVDGSFIEVYGGHTKNIEISGNSVTNVPGGTVEMGSYVGGTVESFSFHHNLISEASTLFLINMDGMYALSAISGITFDNNTFVQRVITDENLMPWSIYGVNGVLNDLEKLKVRNNVFYLKTGTKNTWLGNPASDTSSILGNDDTFTHANNLYFQPSGAPGRFLFATPADPTEIVGVDPLFVSGSDFHLTAASPAIDAGAVLGYTADLEGSPVYAGAAPDLGAYEGSRAPADPTLITPVGSTAGAEQTGNWKAQAYDSNTDTRWCNDGTLANAWIQLDLGAAHSVSKVSLMLENNHLLTYPIRIQIGDGTNFTDVFNGSTSIVGWKQFQDFTFSPVTGRYVRVSLTGANSQGYYWFSAWEIAIHGPSAPFVPVASTAGAEQTGNWKAQAYDNDTDTRWCNDGTLANAWIQLDLGAAHSVSKVSLMLENNHLLTYPIQIQVGDGTNFTTVYSGSTSLVGWKQFQDFTFSPVTGRHVRISLTGANSQGYYWFSAWEIQVE